MRGQEDDDDDQDSNEGGWEKNKPDPSDDRFDDDVDSPRAVEDGNEDSNEATGEDGEDEEPASTSYFGAVEQDEEDDGDEDDDGYPRGSANRRIAPSDQKPKVQLPSARAVLGAGKSKAWESSIFFHTTTHEQEDRAASAVLERHVKLTEKPDASAAGGTDERDRRPVCRMFRKGQCVKGDRCRFAHVVAGGQAANRRAIEGQGPKKQFEKPAIPYNEWEKEDPSSAKKRKRPIGVTNNLQPAKKAMTAFQQQTAKEQPWLVHNRSQMESAAIDSKFRR